MTMTQTAETITFTEGERRVFRIPERISSADWADRHRMVVDGGRKSPWRNDLSPCAYGVMEALDAPYIREVYVQAAPQTIKTQAFMNYLLRRIDQSPTSAMVAMPDEKLQRRFFKRRLLTTIKSTPRTAEVLSQILGDVTRSAIAFNNGMDIIGAWAGSSATLASDAMEVVCADECNKYPEPTDNEPNALDALRQRTNSFPFTYKLYACSTPTGENGLITVTINRRADEIRYYYARCPICGEEQRMIWENITWGDTRDPRKVLREKLARYNCRACGMQWDDDLRNIAVRATMKTGWRADEPMDRPRAVAYILPSWYVLSMSEAVAAFLEGQDDPEQLKTWVTQHCAEPWMERSIKKSENAVLQRQSIYPALIVPPDVVALTAGIDVQKRGFWFVVRGWAEDLTSWLVQYGYMTTWDDVEALIYKTEYRLHESTETMKIWRSGIDTGGGESDESDWSRTEEIYQWLRRQPMGAAQKVFGTKGATHLRALAAKRIKLTRIDTLPSSTKPIPGGLELRLLDSSQYKGLVHFRLGRKDESEDGKPETQRFYVHQGVGIDYVKQLLSEEWRRLGGKHGKKWGWKQTYAHNHLLDCECIAAACADNEWLPNLQMVANYLKRNKGQPADAKPGGRRVISAGVQETGWFKR